ncbi:MAG: UDP-N-acetylglucosamine 1-carboxyvinyltransferase [Gammaproteobacteria bacterium]|nr:UDP-N-acetylglucosamine 1-carboxyvinyltransferase [Gammaproteobacteria bacterium]
MDRLLIHGGRPLEGTTRASGSKNSSLPILAATLLASEPVCLNSLPHLRDITTMVELLVELGANVSVDERLGVTVDTNTIRVLRAPYDLVRKMRASFLVLGPLLARYGKVEVSLPGGCAIGTRPVDQHLKALEQMGADLVIEDGYVKASCDKGLVGANIRMDLVTVGGTQNVMMAATLAKGTTVIENAAREPEIVELASCLRAMGAQISGEGTETIVVEGREQLGGCMYRVMSDRIEVGTYLIAAAATGGHLRVDEACPETLGAVLAKLGDFGCRVIVDGSTIELDARGFTPSAADVRTEAYPGIPTDLQAQFMALNCVSEGQGRITETVFENRFMHVQELVRLGASIRLENPTTAVVTGVKELRGAQVMATDLRASSSLVIGALAAVGTTTISRIYHIDRGYECIEEKLRWLGADIERLHV